MDSFFLLSQIEYFWHTYFVTLWMISRSFQRPARALSSRWVPVGQSNFLARLMREFVWWEWVVEHSSGVSGISFRDMSRIFLNASLLSCVAFRTFLLIALNKRAPWKGKELNLRVWYRPVFSGWIYMVLPFLDSMLVWTLIRSVLFVAGIFGTLPSMIDHK